MFLVTREADGAEFICDQIHTDESSMYLMSNNPVYAGAPMMTVIIARDSVVVVTMHE